MRCTRSVRSQGCWLCLVLAVLTRSERHASAIAGCPRRLGLIFCRSIARSVGRAGPIACSGGCHRRVLACRTFRQVRRADAVRRHRGDARLPLPLLAQQHSGACTAVVDTRPANAGNAGTALAVRHRRTRRRCALPNQARAPCATPCCSRGGECAGGAWVARRTRRGRRRVAARSTRCTHTSTSTSGVPHGARCCRGTAVASMPRRARPTHAIKCRRWSSQLLLRGTASRHRRALCAQGWRKGSGFARRARWAARFRVPPGLAIGARARACRCVASGSARCGVGAAVTRVPGRIADHQDHLGNA